MLHLVDIAISIKIIRKCYEVLGSPLAVVLIGPHTSVCMSSNKSDALSRKHVKGVLAILPCKQASHVLYDSKLNEVRSPSECSFFMCFSLTRPKRQCHI